MTVIFANGEDAMKMTARPNEKGKCGHHHVDEVASPDDTEGTEGGNRQDTFNFPLQLIPLENIGTPL